MIHRKEFERTLFDHLGIDLTSVELAKILPNKGDSNKTERLDNISSGLAGLVFLTTSEDEIIYAGSTGDMRTYCGYFTNPTLLPSPNQKDAITHEYVACKIALDGSVVMAYGIQMPTKEKAASVIKFFKDHFGDAWPTKRNLLFGYDESDLWQFRSSTEPETKEKRNGTGWPPSPNIERNARVEQAAIDKVRAHYGQEGIDRQADNCGWDLEFKSKGRKVCIEVKGVSRNEPVAAVSVTEYRVMQKVMDGDFNEGVYRLAIVTDALTAPKLYIFKYDTENCWKCELTKRKIYATERTAAQLS